MKDPEFLNLLKNEGKLKLVDPSDEICSSYTEKSDKCLKAAKILLENELYENSITMSYYVMYNILTALLFKTGIKCENHSAAIILLKLLFKENELAKEVFTAKEERIDKQYYVATSENLSISSAEDMLEKAESFAIKVKAIINKVNGDFIQKIRTEFDKLIRL